MRTISIAELPIASMRNRLMATAYNVHVLRHREFSISNAIRESIHQQLEEEHRALRNMQRNVKSRVSASELHEIKKAAQAAESMMLKEK